MFFPWKSKFGNVLPCQEEKNDENQIGPYGPSEPFLQHGIEQIGLKKGVMEEHWKFRGVGRLKNQVWGPKLDFWGLFWSQNDF